METFTLLDVLLDATPTLLTVASYLELDEAMMRLCLLSRQIFVRKRYDIYRAVLANSSYTEAIIEEQFMDGEAIDARLLPRQFSEAAVAYAMDGSSPVASLGWDDDKWGRYHEELAWLRKWTDSWEPCVHCGQRSPLMGPHYSCFHDGYAICKTCLEDHKHPPTHLIVQMNNNLPMDEQALPTSPYWEKLFHAEIRKVRCDRCNKKKHDYLIHVPRGYLQNDGTHLSGVFCSLGEGADEGEDVHAQGWDDGELVCENCFDPDTHPGSYYYLRALPEELYPLSQMFSVNRTAWCDSCGRHITGDVFKSINVPDYDLCENCFQSRSDADWKLERHAGFIMVRGCTFQSMKPMPRVDGAPVASADDDVQHWLATQFAGYTAPKVLTCSGMQTAFLQCFDFTSGQYVGLRAVESTNAPDVLLSGTGRGQVDAAFDLLRSVEHPHVLTPLKFVRKPLADGSSTLRYMVFPYMEAGSLDTVLSDSHRHICEEKHVRYYMKQLVEGVGHLHNVGLVHGNLQLRTCLVDSAGAVRVSYPLLMWKLLYGAIGTYAEGCDENNHAAGVESLCSKATVHYLAPEVAAGQPRSRASDVFGLGAIFANLLSSRPLCAQWAHGPQDLVSHLAKNPSYSQPAFLREDLNFGETEGPFSQSTNAANLMRSMLSVDPTSRPDCATILQHPYFNEQ